ncbi:hypothetical protein NM688_g136 [Phlebia brevispora]|uniref:Uncharacterized protein n=1 Tax=Phlebia brevispora TaxID=194682 RepID=A0ACC1TFF4_9APHY|nr:hypothetical protein NM688_g136 [Phlebia brevispora]
MMLFQIAPFLLLLLSSFVLPTFTKLAERRSVPSGIVTTRGQQFELDGKSFWLPLLTTKDDVDKTLRSMHAVGVKVLRTWVGASLLYVAEVSLTASQGFNAINASELAGALESGLTYYQTWNSTQWQLDEGQQGLQRLDYVIETAGKYDIKVIVAFTNNWVGYGGSDLYIQWIKGAGQTHDIFFTDPDIVASYQSYVRTIVERYKNSTTIFAWELMNEARCASDTLSSSSACVPGSNTLLAWYREQSDFVRSLDPLHLITTGGEGQFFWKTPPEYWFDGTLISDFNFNGQAGEDFDHNLDLPNIDFGTYHMYPQTWYPELDTLGSNFSVEEWGLGWISDHANSAKKAGKPLLLEEFADATGTKANKSTIYPSWVQRALDTDHAYVSITIRLRRIYHCILRYSGIMPWQFGQLGLTEDGGNRIIKYSDQLLNGASPNDGFAIYPNQTSVWDIFKHAAEVQASRSG